MSSLQYKTVYKRLFDAYGPQHWWPGDTPFEIMVGAILTQNTAWSNVEKAITNLQAKDRLEPRAIAGTRRDHLANWLRPSGYFNVKAERLQAFCRWYLDAGGYAGLVVGLKEGLEVNFLGLVAGINPAKLEIKVPGFGSFSL